MQANEIYPQYDSSMCKVLKALQTVPIIAAANAHKGTQLKLNLLVEGNQSIFFKPAWYKKNKIIDGAVYSGKDRHNSEIVAFYLGALLNLRWTPVAVGRAINLKEVWKISDAELQDSMNTKRKKIDSILCRLLIKFISIFRKRIKNMPLRKMFLLQAGGSCLWQQKSLR